MAQDTSIFTLHYSFPLPSPGNKLAADVARLAELGVGVDSKLYQQQMGLEWLTGELGRLESSSSAAHQAQQQAIEQLAGSKMAANAVIPISQGGTGATTLAAAQAALGITDPAWANIKNKPTTIAGYGITDYTFTGLGGKPTTLEGYGITNGMPRTGGRFSGPVQMPNGQAVGYGGDPGGLMLGSGSGAAVLSMYASGYALNMGLDADAVFRIGGWSQGSGAYRLHLDTAGNLATSGNITAYSDRRLKKDFAVIDGALDKLKKLTGYTFTRTDTGERQTGLIAQEVRDVMPEAVTDMLGLLTVAYGNLLGLVVEAVKEVDAKLEAQKERGG